MDKHLNYYEVRWKNFKGFKDTQWIKIKPITILLGPNNSGKTSFLAPFLLMNQTLTSRDAYSPIISKGQVYDGGSIQELINNYDLSKNISLAMRYHIHETDEELDEMGSDPPGAFEVTIGVNEEDGELIVKSESIYDTYYREFFRLFLKKNKKYSMKGAVDLSKMRPEEISAINSITPNSPINFLFSADSFLLNLFKQREEGKMKKRKGFSKEFTNLLDILSFNYSRVRQYVGELSYIGPIRENPHRVYEVSNEIYNTVGSKGENMANLLKRHFTKRNKRMDLWIKKFGFGDWLELKKLYGNSYSIRFRENNSELYTSIANAGFGASQLLPLIVQALCSPKGSLTIAEQPEIHLNPRLQCELADLFAFMAKQDQRIIVETHSEHLLLRLRKLIANKTISSEDVAIYFVEKNAHSSIIRSINVEKDGHIRPDQWPKDFFEDSLRESFSLAREQLKNKN